MSSSHAPLRADSLEGHVLRGQYRIDALIGEGGMALVYRATQMSTGAIFAIKVLRERRQRSESGEVRFLREASTQSRLKHPHIVRVYDVFEEQGIIGFVQEWCAGGDLHQFLLQREGPMSKEQLREIFLPLLDAVIYAHDRGLIHRDIKPANVLIHPEDSTCVKLNDFGLVKVLALDSLTSTGTVMGTVHYMAPEQFEETKGVDHRADIYSLGVLLYELSTGRLPFSGRMPALGMKIIKSPPPPAREAPYALRGVLEQCLRKRPDERYQTCRSLKDAVVMALDSDVTASEAETGDKASGAMAFAQTAPTPVYQIPAAEDLSSDGRRKAAFSTTDPLTEAHSPKKGSRPAPGLSMLGTSKASSRGISLPWFGILLFIGFAIGVGGALYLQKVWLVRPPQPSPRVMPRTAPRRVASRTHRAHRPRPLSRMVLSRRPEPPVMGLAKPLAVRGSVPDAGSLSPDKAQPPDRTQPPDRAQPPDRTRSPDRAYPLDGGRSFDGSAARHIAGAPRFASDAGTVAPAIPDANAATRVLPEQASERPMAPPVRGLALRPRRPAALPSLRLAPLRKKPPKIDRGGDLFRTALNHERGKQLASARRILAESCRYRHAAACARFGWYAFRAMGGKRMPTLGLSMFAKACKLGHVISCYNLGIVHQEARFGQKVQYDKARVWYALACKREHTDACVRLGMMLLKGHGGKRDGAGAVKLFKKACDKGNGKGCRNLGFMFYKVYRKLPNHMQIARQYAAKGCQGNVVDSCLLYAQMLLFGQGGPKRHRKAYKLFIKTCQSNNAAGCVFAASSLARGVGVRRQLKRARHFAAKSCRLNDEDGCHMLARMYAHGRGGGRDCKRANSLFRKACQLGEKSACREFCVEGEE